MGIWDEANTMHQNELNAQRKQQMWASVGASENDPIAAKHSANQKKLIAEFIGSVPEICWHKNYRFCIRSKYNDIKYYRYVVKYQAPDGTIRLYYDEGKPHCTSYGNHEFLVGYLEMNYIGPPIVIYRDGYLFAKIGDEDDERYRREVSEYLNKFILISLAKGQLDKAAEARYLMSQGKCIYCGKQLGALQCECQTF